MRRLWLGVLTTVGCNQIIGIDQLHDDRTCLGTLAEVCAHPLRGDVNLSPPGPLDTDTDPRCETSAQPFGNPDLCVIAARDITVVGDLTTTGSRPLALFATGTLVVQTGATLDASSYRDDHAGPGASSVLCSSAMLAGTSGGGAGGSFGGKGGDGGNGAGLGMHGVAAAAIPPQTLSGVRGSCAGDPGGPSATGAAAVVGGASGGTLYLLANGSIDVELTSTIVASGAGGEGNLMAGGGGGGGAGGLVALDAPAITIAGQIVAHGGGGGTGGGPAATTAGPGGDDGPMAFGDRSVGATGVGGGDGGRGSYGTFVGGGTGGPSATGGGGGGGGGAGIILVHGTLTAQPTLVTPALVMQ